MIPRRTRQTLRLHLENVREKEEIRVAWMGVEEVMRLTSARSGHGQGVSRGGFIESRLFGDDGEHGLGGVRMREHQRLTFTTWNPADGVHRAISVNNFVTHTV